MTQPLNQRGHCEALGELDQEAGEFWMENPWQAGEHNLSAFERNRVLLNVPVDDGQGRRLLDVSHLTAADLDSDSRAVAAGDLNRDGMPDLIVRSSGGGPVHVLENNWPRTNWLIVSLRGRESNRLGLGARIKIQTGERILWREMYPVSSYLSQQPSRLHFGLADAKRIDQLTVLWPSGRQQHFTGLTVNRHIVIEEGGEVRDW